MTSIEHFQPIRPIRRPRRRAGRYAGCGAFVFWAAVGYLAAALLSLGLFFSVNTLFPPPRLNLLLIGTDRRPGETGPARSDTLILVTVNPGGPAIGMLSIPRDLWVTLPGDQQNRINTAYFFAEAASPGTGPQAALDTVASNFGLTVQRYIRLDFDGFVRIIDSVGGITVNVEAPIVDDAYPTYDHGIQTIRFEAGEQHLDGERALQYARTRHGSSDFDRAKRQQAIIAAFARRLLQPEAWPRLPFLLIALKSSIDTNLTPLDVLRALPTLILVGPDGIDRRVIERDMVQPFTTQRGAAVLQPVWEKINPVLLEMFGE